MAFAEAVHEAFAGTSEALGLVGMAWHVERGEEMAIEGRCGRESVIEGAKHLSPDQRWHWGSCAKALTATVLASVVDEGTFLAGWDTRLGDILDLPEPSGEGTSLAYSTLRQLAAHRGGVCLDLEAAVEEALRTSVQESTASGQRMAFARELAGRALDFEPGAGFGYSNAGYAVLSAAVEKVTGKPWEDLVMKRVVEPLCMRSFGFGSPPRDETGGDALGHDENGEVDKTNGTDALWHHASFSVHSTLADWAIFARLHLRTLQGDTAALAVLGVSASSAAVLHTPLSPAADGELSNGQEKPLSMAMGWQCLWEEPPEGQRGLAAATGVLWHWGTNFRFNSGAYLRAEPPLLILVGSNSGSSLARLASRTAFEAVIVAASTES
ncbi:unnamed protein product [Polarella glacialis]|uniref:Beta-lactamase-related domain-containing protein n=2 Tax=Polarella glacialis TaxID=89957 RepID=A0A813EN44_POLGL|nr:unnamed protein product [Polarella glacialis]